MKICSGFNRLLSNYSTHNICNKKYDWSNSHREPYKNTVKYKYKDIKIMIKIA